MREAGFWAAFRHSLTNSRSDVYWQYSYRVFRKSAVFIKSNNQRHRYFAFLALVWMKGMPIRDLVTARLEFTEIPDEEKSVNEEIRDFFARLKRNSDTVTLVHQY